MEIKERKSEEPHLCDTSYSLFIGFTPTQMNLHVKKETGYRKPDTLGGVDADRKEKVSVEMVISCNGIVKKEGESGQALSPDDYLQAALQKTNQGCND